MKKEPEENIKLGVVTEEPKEAAFSPDENRMRACPSCGTLNSIFSSRWCSNETCGTLPFEEPDGQSKK
jgi:hypothetical protein